jgi:hypothetical protein
MAKEEKKIDKMQEKELLEYVNNAYKQGKKLEEIATELDTKKSTLSSKLKSYGYIFKNGAYVKIAEDTKKNVEELDLLYIATSSFATQLSARVNGETKDAFEKLCAEKYPNVAVAKLISLALKEFTEKHK